MTTVNIDHNQSEQLFCKKQCGPSTSTSTYYIPSLSANLFRESPLALALPWFVSHWAYEKNTKLRGDERKKLYEVMQNTEVIQYDMEKCRNGSNGEFSSSLAGIGRRKAQVHMDHIHSAPIASEHISDIREKIQRKNTKEKNCKTDLTGQSKTLL